MLESIAKQPINMMTEHEKVTRRSFVSGAAALAGAAVAVTYPGTVYAAGTVVDLRSMDNPASPGTKISYVTPIKSQSSCNACTAFAVVAAIEGTYNKWKNLPGDASEAINLSEGQLFFAAGPKDKCVTTHWWPEDALAYCANVGLAREDQADFVAEPKSNPVLISRAVNLMRMNLNKTQDAIKDWITNTGPVIAVMAEYNDFFLFNVGTSKPYFPGVDYADKPPKLWFVGGHVVAIIGYDDGQKCWICKNSYGTKWNGTAKGYVNIAYGGQPNQQDCFIDSLDVWGVSFN